MKRRSEVVHAAGDGGSNVYPGGNLSRTWWYEVGSDGEEWSVDDPYWEYTDVDTAYGPEAA